MNRIPEEFSRLGLLTGTDGLERLRNARVLVVGVGGVGSWCVEALARSAVGHITIVDSDCVDVTNINRQLPATTLTVGKTKVEVLRERILAINPACDCRALRLFYDEQTASQISLADFDFVVDAIDSLSSKALLILNTTASGVPLASSMGAARKCDPERIRIAEFWKVKGCPLARALRDRFKRSGLKPRRKFRCVYSDELLPRLSSVTASAPNGTICHATAIFGMMLASIVIRSLLSKSPDHAPIVAQSDLFS